jgi:hypothetical protein
MRRTLQNINHMLIKILMSMHVYKKSALSALLRATVLMALLFAALPAQLHAASMQNYCVVPPYVTSEVAPNIMIMMDNSSDMYTTAYGTNQSFRAIMLKRPYLGYFDRNPVINMTARYGVPKRALPTRKLRYELYRPTPAISPFRGNLELGDHVQIRCAEVIIGGNAVSSSECQYPAQYRRGQKTYNNCVFNVSNANLTITENVAGACALLDLRFLIPG